MGCLNTTPAIQKLHDDHFSNIEIGKLKDAISLWQQRYNKNMDELPSKSQIERILNEIDVTRAIRDTGLTDEILEIPSTTFADYEFIVRGTNRVEAIWHGNSPSIVVHTDSNDVILSPKGIFIDDILINPDDEAYSSLKLYFPDDLIRIFKPEAIEAFLELDEDDNTGLGYTKLDSKLREKYGLFAIRKAIGEEDQSQYDDFNTKQVFDSIQKLIQENKKIPESVAKHFIPQLGQIQTATANWSRKIAKEDPKTLYIFTDNINRDSGSGRIDPNSPYAKRYGKEGETLHYPGATSAQIRGLENAMPVSTQKYYERNGRKGVTGRWGLEDDIEEFKEVIDQEFDDILAEWETGKYDRIMFPKGGLVGNESGISGMTLKDRERGEYAKYIQEKVDWLTEKITGEKPQEKPNGIRDANIFEESSSTPTQWSRTSKNGYEVSSRGDKRFSAFNAKFKRGTQLFGKDVGGMSVEQVWQEVAKQSGKGKAPKKGSVAYDPETGHSTEQKEDYGYEHGYLPIWREWAKQNPVLIDALRRASKGKTLTDQFASTRANQARALAQILNETSHNKNETREAEMSFAYNGEQREGITSKTTLEAIKKGERTATTRYKYLDFWKSFKIGDIIKFNSGKDYVYVRVTKPATRLKSNTNPEEWSKKEGWSIEHFHRVVEGKLDSKDGAWQIEFTPVKEEEIESIEKQYAEEKKKKGLPEIFEELRKFVMNDIGGETDFDQYAIPNEQIKKAREDSVDKLQAHLKVDSRFDSKTRKNRERLIASLYSDEVTKALNEQQEILQGIIDDPNSTDEEKDDASTQLLGLTRIGVMKTIRPRNLFNRIKDNLTRYCESLKANETTYVNDNYNALVEIGWGDSDEQRHEKAKQMYDYELVQYENMVSDGDVFDILCEGAVPYVKVNENVQIVVNFMDKEEEQDVRLAENGEFEQGEETADDRYDNKEVNSKDNYMSNVYEVSSVDTMSNLTRRALASISEVDANGESEVDDLGFPVHLDPVHAHSTLVNALMDIILPDDMWIVLNHLARTQGWVNELIDKLNEDEVLRSQFYRDFRLDFSTDSLQRIRTNPDGTTYIQTINLNTPEGTHFLLEKWQFILQGGQQLDPNDSIYDNRGQITDEGIRKAKKALDGPISNLIAHFRDIQNNREQVLKDCQMGTEYYDQIMKLLKMVGIQTSPVVLEDALTNYPEDTGNMVHTPPVLTLLEHIYGMYEKVGKGEASVADEDQRTSKVDVMLRLKGWYGKIAKMLMEVTKNAVETSSRQGSRTRYSHHAPNYMGAVIKELKDTMGKYIQDGNSETGSSRFQKYVEDQFGRFEWFRDPKTKRWLNDIIRHLTDPKLGEGAREMLNKKTLSYIDGKTTDQWSDFDYTLALMGEYWAEPDAQNSIKYTYYAIPVLADAMSAEFIRLRRYTNDKQTNANFIEDILDRLEDLLQQELQRIELVEARDKKLQEGIVDDAGPVVDMGYYDITRDKNGNITSYGGSEFKFLTWLNGDDHGKTTRREITEAKQSMDSNEFRNYIRDMLFDGVEEVFNAAMDTWEKMGLFEVNEKGLYKNVSFIDGSNVITKRKAAANAMARTLEVIRDVLDDDTIEGVEQVIEGLREGAGTVRMFRNEAWAEAVVQQALQDMYNDGRMDYRTYLSYSANTRIDNILMDGMREFFWNHYLATANIIQVFNTDMAFFKNPEEFYKRNKHIYSPAYKLNTKAMYNGEKVGREIEKTILLRDDEIVSHRHDDMQAFIKQSRAEGVLDSHKISDFDAANMLAKNGVSNVELDTIVGQDDEGNDIIKKVPYAKVGDVLVKTEKVNVTDGQALRSLSSYRAVAIMAGEWDKNHDGAAERAYQNIISPDNKWTMDDFNVIWQIIKPFTYTQIPKHSGVVGHTDIKMPFRNKNSEFLLLVMYRLANELGGERAEKLRAINEFMEDKGIDVIQFESTTKTGKQGPVDLNGIANDDPDCFDKVVQTLNEAAFPGGNENPNVVHSVPYSDYGIQTSTPEHLIDQIQLVGTQVRKLIAADISDDAKLRINGRTMSKKEWLKFYNGVITANIMDAFKKVDSIFNNPKEVERVIQDTVRDNPRYSREIAKACLLDADGNFALPLYDPIQSNIIQQMLNSIIRSRVTKQKVKGGSAIQVSDFGLSTALEIEWKGNKKTGKMENVECFQCYLGAWASQFKDLLIDESGYLNINAKLTKKRADGSTYSVYILPENLRKMLGYRIPTEDKYSMAPLKVMGFLPSNNGAAIMLPSEITMISGSDFDVDKLFLLIPDFRIVDKYDISEAWSDFYKTEKGKELLEEADLKIFLEYLDWKEQNPDSNIKDDKEYWERIKKPQGAKKYQFSEEAQQTFSEWFTDNRKKQYYMGQVFEKIKYDYSKDIRENDTKARNNLMIDLMYGVLTNEDTTAKLLNPGGYEDHKKTAKALILLRNYTEAEISEILKGYKKSYGAVGININTEFGTTKPTDITVSNKNGITSKQVIDTSANSVAMELFKLSSTDLAALADKLASQLDVLSPTTQVRVMQLNTVGKRLIPIYAVQNSNHALMQHSALAVNDNGSFTLFGRSPRSLHEIRSARGEIITKNVAGFLNAAVDNAKDHILADLNQNLFTAPTTCLLLRLGYSPQEVGIFISQPIIMDITERFFREGREGKYKGEIIDDVLTEYRKKAGIKEELEYDQMADEDFSLQELTEAIMLQKEMENVDNPFESNDPRIQYYYDRQYKLGVLFKRIMTVSDAMAKVTVATRSDTQNGGAGPTNADTMLKILNVTSLLESAKGDNFPLSGIDFIEAGLRFEKDDDGRVIRKRSDDELWDIINQMPVPYLQAFYTFGVEGAANIMSNYFPHFTDIVTGILKSIQGLTKNGRLDAATINNICNDFFTYLLTSIEFFGAEESKGISARQKRLDFIVHYPERYEEIVSKEGNEAIAELNLLNRIIYITDNDKNPNDQLVLSNVGGLRTEQKDDLARDWTSLLYMDNEDAGQLAFDLFRYGFFRTGFAFGPNNFTHLTPTKVRMMAKTGTGEGYVEFLRNLKDRLGNNSTLIVQPFVMQYVRNHTHNKNLVVPMPDTMTANFIKTNEKGHKDFADTVTVEVKDSANRRVVKEQKRIFSEQTHKYYTRYEYLPFISKNEFGETAYYRLIDDKEMGTRHSGKYAAATYVRFYPLGLPFQNLEYEYGAEAFEVESVIKWNEEGYNPSQESNGKGGTFIMDGDYDIEQFEQSYKERYGDEDNVDIGDDVPYYPNNTDESESGGDFGDLSELNEFANFNAAKVDKGKLKKVATLTPTLKSADGTKPC